MILRNVKVTGSDKPVDIGIKNGLIVDAASLGGQEASLHFENAVAFPGLINSHDHLDFNLFPQLGNKVYTHYTQWGKHIHETYRDEIDETLKIPVALRAQWGAYKNLLAGVTTVVNHGEQLNLGNELITVVENAQCLHSVGFQKKWKLRLNNPLKKKIPVNIHVGEGTDDVAKHEIDQLTKWNLLNRKLIGVHGVAMTENQAKKFKALVWCPESNYFLLGKTAPVDLLKNNTAILFGTDSTLTSGWNIWDHLRLARTTGLLTDQELYNAVTTNAAEIWGLNSGRLTPGKDADLIVATQTTDGFFGISPESLLLVMHQGQIRLFDDSVSDQIPWQDLKHYSRIHIGGACKYVLGDLPDLMDAIIAYSPKASFPVNSNPVLC